MYCSTVHNKQTQSASLGDWGGARGNREERHLNRGWGFTFLPRRAPFQGCLLRFPDLCLCYHPLLMLSCLLTGAWGSWAPLHYPEPSAPPSPAVSLNAWSPHLPPHVKLVSLLPLWTLLRDRHRLESDWLVRAKWLRLGGGLFHWVDKDLMSTCCLLETVQSPEGTGWISYWVFLAE